MSVMGLINTVLCYKKGSKNRNIFSISENMKSQLSNALSIVLISLKLVEILRIEFFSVAPPKVGDAFTKQNVKFRVILQNKKFYFRFKKCLL